MAWIDQLIAAAPLAFIASTPTWAIIAAPVFTALLTWHVAMLKHKHEVQHDRHDFDLREQERLRLERDMIHTESVAQTDAQTRRFIALMESYDSRVDDLNTEVRQLRAEVVALRKVLDRQRAICRDCDRLSQWSLLEQPGDPFDAAD